MLIRIPPFRVRGLPVQRSRGIWAGIKGGYEDEDGDYYGEDDEEDDDDDVEDGEEEEGDSEDSESWSIDLFQSASTICKRASTVLLFIHKALSFRVRFSGSIEWDSMEGGRYLGE